MASDHAQQRKNSIQLNLSVDGTRYSLEVHQSMRSPAVVFLNGEKEQMDVLANELQQYLVEEILLYTCKLPSSSSGSLQPADVCDLFKHSKAYI